MSDWWDAPAEAPSPKATVPMKIDRWLAANPDPALVPLEDAWLTAVWATDGWTMFEVYDATDIKQLRKWRWEKPRDDRLEIDLGEVARNLAARPDITLPPAEQARDWLRLNWPLQDASGRELDIALSRIEGLQQYRFERKETA